MSETNPREPGTANLSFEILISVGAALAVLSSVIYNWAYFYTIGFSENELITLSDIVASSIGWVPPVATALCAGFFLSALGLPPDKYLKRGATRSDYIMVGLGLITALTQGLFVPSYDWPNAIAGLLLAWTFGFPMLDMRPITFRYGTKAALVVFTLPLMLGIALIAGGTAAVDAMKETTFKSDLVFRGHQKEVGATIFRYLDRGVLYRRSSDGQLVFTLWGEIAGIKKSSRHLDERSRVCSWFGAGCPQPKVTKSIAVKKP